MESIKVLVVDAHALFRVGVVSLLQRQADFEVVGEALSATRAVQVARDLKPDIVLMDMDLAHADGLETLQQLKTSLPRVKIVLFTSAEKEDELLQAISNGAQGYLPKQIQPEGLYRTLRGVFRGEAALSRTSGTLLCHAFARLRSVNQPPAQETPSQREREVLNEVATGASNKDIAVTLGISENTVKTHLRNVMNKLHLENRVQAATYALRSKNDAA